MIQREPGRRELRRMIAGRRRPSRPRRDWQKISTQVTSFAALAALIFTGLSLTVTYYQAKLSEQGQVTDRYSRSVEQLGSANLDVRLGAVYALERLTHDSPQDRVTIRAVLAAFVQSHAKIDKSLPPKGATPGYRGRLIDVEAALTVLSRTTEDDDPPRDLRGTGFLGVDLRYGGLSTSDLSGGDFRLADLRGADLHGSALVSSDLANADIELAELSGADLVFASAYATDFSGTRFIGADLSNAKFENSDFTDADLSRTHLTGTEFKGSTFVGATFAGAAFVATSFQGADLLTADLRNASLGQTDFTGANLLGAQLDAADLREATFTNADLEGATFTGTQLDGARFTGAHFGEGWCVRAPQTCRNGLPPTK